MKWLVRKNSHSQRQYWAIVTVDVAVAVAVAVAADCYAPAFAASCYAPALAADCYAPAVAAGCYAAATGKSQRRPMAMPYSTLLYHTIICILHYCDDARTSVIADMDGDEGVMSPRTRKES